MLTLRERLALRKANDKKWEFIQGTGNGYEEDKPIVLPSEYLLQKYIYGLKIDNVPGTSSAIQEVEGNDKFDNGNNDTHRVSILFDVVRNGEIVSELYELYFRVDPTILKKPLKKETLMNIKKILVVPKGLKVLVYYKEEKVCSKNM